MGDSQKRATARKEISPVIFPRSGLVGWVFVCSFDAENDRIDKKMGVECPLLVITRKVKTYSRSGKGKNWFSLALADPF